MMTDAEWNTALTERQNFAHDRSLFAFHDLLIGWERIPPSEAKTTYLQAKSIIALAQFDVGRSARLLELLEEGIRRSTTSDPRNARLLLAQGVLKLQRCPVCGKDLLVRA